jgi:hypothetical protein
MHSSILILCGLVLTILILPILILSSLILSALILHVRILCVLVVLTLVVWLIPIVLLVVGHVVVRIHDVHVLVMLLVRNIGRRLPPTRRSRTADHIGAVSSSLYILPSRQMAVTHRAGLGIE